MTIPSFDSTLRTRVVFGAGSLDRLGELAASLGGHRVLLVTDAGIVRAGHAARAVSRLKAAGLEVTVFDAVRENPTVEHLVRPVHGGDLVRENDRDVELGLALRRARRRADLLHGLIEGPGRGIGLEGDGQALLVPMDRSLMGDQGAAQSHSSQEHSGRDEEKSSESHHNP